MENELPNRRGMILGLVIVVVIIFVGLVWLIARAGPWGQLKAPVEVIIPPTVRMAQNCTYPVAYWKMHPELYPSRLVLGDQVYGVNQIENMLTAESQEPGARLQAQLVAAFLNGLSGADQSLIENTVFQAYSWTVRHPDSSQLSDADRQVGTWFSDVLEAYNLGQAGVVACSYIIINPPTDTITPTLTPSPILTGTPSETPTPTPSETATSTTPPTFFVWTPAVSSPTYIPTTEPPGGPQDTPYTEPSNTPEPPTNTPAPPTNTPKPPEPTNTPTEEPTLPPPP